MDMKIERKYHFYAAHRNKAAGEKCGRIHGHCYDLVLTFSFEKVNERINGITMLFSDIDAQAEPIIKSFDHFFILHDLDPLCELLDLAGEQYHPVPFETSAENMAVWIFTRIRNETELPLCKIELAETKSSNVIYERY
jgi:6-pyruvoyl-tetrahydropterin synthase